MSNHATWSVIRRADTLPHFQIALWSCPSYTDRISEILFQSKGVEGQLYPIALPRDDPGAVGIVGVAVGEPRALDNCHWDPELSPRSSDLEKNTHTRKHMSLACL